MHTDIKRDFKIAFAVAAIILGYGFCGDAHAQTTQPVYVRPSKGANIPLFTDYLMTGATTPPGLSPVYDMTAFNAVQVRVEAKNAATGADIVFSQCTRLPAIFTTGALTKTGPFSTEFFDQNGQFVNYPFGNISVTYTVNRVSPYVQFSTSIVANSIPNAAAGTDCKFTASITPLPFQTGVALVEPRLEGREFDIVTVSNLGAGAFVYRFNAAAACVGCRVPYVRVQNVGTAPLICIVNDPNVASAVTTSHYSFALAAGTADDDGKGGAIEFKNLSSFSGQVICLAVGAPSRASVLSFTEIAP